MLTRKSREHVLALFWCLSGINYGAGVLRSFTSKTHSIVDAISPCTVAFAPAAANKPIDPTIKY